MTTTAARSYLNLPAPAKLNLFLHVIGQRSDGKHLLESIFILINLFDTMKDLTASLNARATSLAPLKKTSAYVRPRHF